VTDEHRCEPFDEKTALAELEQLHAAIQAARQARQQTSEEFARFVQQFRKPASIDREIAAPRTPDASSQTPSPLPPSTLPTEASPPSQSIDAVSAVADVTAPVPQSLQAWRRRRPLGIGLGVAAAIGVMVLGVTFTRSRRERAVPRPAAPTVNSSASRAHVQTPPPAAPLAVPASGVVLELRTVRSVWTRVVVDGQKKLESIVPAGQALRFAADRSIVVRVGNGADVLVKTGDAEKPLGTAGQPVTRTFTRPEEPHTTTR
jgi:hypothetical protein